MALVIVLMLIVGGFTAGMTHEQGWGMGMVALRGIVAALVVGALIAAYTWWKHRQLLRADDEVLTEAQV